MALLIIIIFLWSNFPEIYLLTGGDLYLASFNKITTQVIICRNRFSSKILNILTFFPLCSCIFKQFFVSRCWSYTFAFNCCLDKIIFNFMQIYYFSSILTCIHMSHVYVQKIQRKRHFIIKVINIQRSSNIYFCIKKVSMRYKQMIFFTYKY